MMNLIYVESIFKNYFANVPENLLVSQFINVILINSMIFKMFMFQCNISKFSDTWNHFLLIAVQSIP